MHAATGPEPRRGLAVVHRTRDGLHTGTLDDLPDFLRPGDLLVLNDASTLPAALPGSVRGQPVEIRLARFRGGNRWIAALLGEGTWRTPTEHRGPPPEIAPGDVLAVGDARATVREVLDPRLAEIELDRPWLDVARRWGEPVRYSYLRAALPLASFQTVFGRRPWASESPSAGLPLRWADLLRLRRHGVAIATVTHAAGLSSIDGGALDRRLPLPERSDVPQRTIDAIHAAKRVIAVGTTVVRALEGRELVAGEAETSLVLGPDTPLRVVHGVLTKLHEPGESHFSLLTALIAPERLAAAVGAAGDRGFQTHELGDTLAILPE